MKFYIRTMCMDDADDIYNIRVARGVFENMNCVPTYTRESSRKKIESILNSGRSHSLVTVLKEDDGTETVIANAGLVENDRSRTRHVAHLYIQVHPDWQGKGIGGKLLEALTDLSDNWLNIHRLELSVVEDNERAIYLYERYGFEREGISRDAMFKDGKYVNLVNMARIRKYGNDVSGATGVSDASTEDEVTNYFSEDIVKDI